VSIGWTDINPVLKEVITECVLDTTRLSEGFKAEWKDGPRSLTSPHQRLSLLMKVARVSGLGEDETRTTEVTVGDVTTVTETQTGQRKVTLLLQAIVPEHTDEQWGMAAMERIRMRLRRPRIIDRLLDLEVSLIDIGDAIDGPLRDRGRIVSGATMEVFLGAVANEDDPIPANWIQYLVISSHLAEGTELPAGQQMVNVEVPTIPTA
jgi:hypothetical protein